MPRTREVDGQLCVMDYDSPRVTAEFYECALPLTFDQYNKCGFNCRYCFAAFLDGGITSSRAKAKGDAIDPAGEHSKYRNPVRSVDPDKVKALWLEPAKHRSGIGPFLVDLIQRRTPLHWGGLCDPFDPLEERFKVGYELLLFFRALDWPLVFSTKGALMTKPPYSEVLAGANARFQFSIVCMDDWKSKIVDSGAPMPSARFEAMRFVTRELGLDATLRLRPIIPGVVTPEECCQLIERAHECGARGVSTEFFCLETRGMQNRLRYERMSKAAGFDLFDFYRQHSPGQSGYLRLTRAVKEPYFKQMKATAESLGMRFAVSDMHWKELNNVAGCCGVYWDDEQSQLRDGREGVFLNRGTVTEAHQIAREKGEVTWADVAPTLGWADHPVRHVSQIQGVVGNAKLRARYRDMSLADVMRSYWNDPNKSKSPYRYGGGKLVPARVDEHGDVVYKYVEDGCEPLESQEVSERDEAGRVHLKLA